MIWRKIFDVGTTGDNGASLFLTVLIVVVDYLYVGIELFQCCLAVAGFSMFAINIR